jgi:spore maturation protein SpmB
VLPVTSVEHGQKGILMAGNSSGPNVWSLLIIVAALAATGAITYFVIDEYATASEATSVLGVALPLVGVIAGATFGVAVAWPAARAKGEADGKAEVKRQVAKEIEALLPDDAAGRGIVPSQEAQDPKAEAIIAGVRGIVAGLRA